MSPQIVGPVTQDIKKPVGWKKLFNLDSRFTPPIFITCILLAGHLSFGMLESTRRHFLLLPPVFWLS